MKTYQILTLDFMSIVIKADSFVDVINELKESGLKPISVVELHH